MADRVDVKIQPPQADNVGIAGGVPQPAEAIVASRQEIDAHRVDRDIA
jgi:hypothetical protein